MSGVKVRRAGWGWRMRVVVACRNCGDDFVRLGNTRYCSDYCRFVDKFIIVGTCWVWEATVNRDGYGTFYLGRNAQAHQASYALHGLAVPEGLELDHRCRNRACVNPEHLEPVTRRVNILRGAAPTALTYLMNRCKRGHEFTPENTITKGGDPSKRQCRTCQNAARRARYAEQRSA